MSSKGLCCSFLAHSSDIDDLLEGLDGVLEDWLDGLHDSKSSLHVVDLWLHAFDGLHLSGDLNKGLSIIESLEDSSGKGLLDVCLLYTSPSPRDKRQSRMPSSA